MVYCGRCQWNGPDRSLPRSPRRRTWSSGLLAREGTSTPYELKRHVAATIGHFWSFPHALLYKEPAHLAGLGLVTEERELDGRRRRLFTITTAGREALRAWLSHPARQPTELRDLALLQLFFADLEFDGRHAGDRGRAAGAAPAPAGRLRGGSAVRERARRPDRDQSHGPALARRDAQDRVALRTGCGRVLGRGGGRRPQRR